MVKCRYYGSEQLRKDGIVKGKQRYKCKRTTRENDQRYRWCRLEWYGIMVLKRHEDVLHPLIIKWIRNYFKILKELIAKATVAETIKRPPQYWWMSFCYTVINLAVGRNQNQILGHCHGFWGNGNSRFAGI